MRQQNILKAICALALVVCLAVGLLPSSAFVQAAEGEPTVTIDNNGSRLVAKVENISNPAYQWMIADPADGTYKNIDGATEKYYDITSTDEGKEIKVTVNNYESVPTDPIGKLIVFDLAKAAVTLGQTYSGKDENDNPISGTHVATNIYVIKQSNNSTLTTNNVTFSGHLPSTPFDVTLAGVNMGRDSYATAKPNTSTTGNYKNGTIDIQAPASAQKKVTLRLKGENIVRVIRYYTGNSVRTTESSLKITDINGDGATNGGSLYMPVKVASEDIDSFVQTDTNYNHWNAAIGGDDSQQDVVNLHIAGGKLQVLTTYGDNCTAIGGGGNGYCRMTISGGDIVAHCNGTGTAIGGGIGWNSAGGQSDITITGGNIYAQNHGEIYVKASRNESGSVVSTTITTKDKDYNEVVGGVAIGSGSSFISSGSEGKVTITGGIVKAYGTFGNGIGGGNSSSSTGGKATISITGGDVDATSIGGGNSQKGTGGAATVTISGTADVTLSGGIGGGDSVSGTGGSAKVTVETGTLNCGGVIGGGNGGVTGDGGTAEIHVNGGTLTAASIGGGIGSVGGNGGAAEIYITDGTIETGSIGGGSTLNASGKLGYAKADITGGDISGQFLMAAGGTQPCTFAMSGGRLHGVDTSDTSKYQYVQKNGAAVYMDDPEGQVTMTGGIIEDCSAQNGGAVYMTAGTFTISEDTTVEPATKGIIQNCTATENGGAVYLGGGIMNVTGGQIINNTAQNSGGGAYINNGNYKMTGGNVDYNTSTEGSGGGIYVASAGEENVKVDVLSGSVSHNSAKQNGGALAVVGTADGTNTIGVTIGVNKAHYDENGNKITCEHGAVNECAYDCPVLAGNHVEASGGAIYVTGNTSTTLDIFCLTERNSTAGGDNGQSNFMKVDGGKVTITTSDENSENNQTAKHGNSHVTGTVYVTGGQMDIWGEMTNPRLEEIITVDITKEGDYFKDHRKVEGYYKLLYYENFTDPVTQITTGQYKEKEIKIDSDEIISGNIYSHPGYTIVGWNTDSSGADDFKQTDQPDQDKGWYDIGVSYHFDGTPIGDLILYAIWEANGYVVKFDPNVPIGETYSGTMGEVSFTYDKEETLPSNQYVRPGYNFQGWATASDGKVEYSDGANITNLTSEKGKAVTLYAVWEKCDHDPEEHTYSYSVVDNGTTLKRDCSCGGYSETATLSAEDTVYDKTTHPAKAIYSSGEWKPEIRYAKEKDGVYNSIEGEPFFAGIYTASVTDGGKTASVTYIIEKAEQPAPGKPEFTVETNIAADGSVTTILRVSPVADSPLKDSASEVYDSNYQGAAQYRIVYYVNGVEYSEDWVIDTNAGDEYAAEFRLNVALTNYYIYARYSEDDNYKASDPTPADSVYFYDGEVQFYVECGEGIQYLPNVASGDDVTKNGIELKVWTEDGYYFPNTYNGSIVLKVNKAEGGAEVTGTTLHIEDVNSGDEYYKNCKIEHIEERTIVRITLPDAKKIPTISAAITEKQVFGKVTTDTATISKDSAYTVFFDVNDYHVDDYEKLLLTFDQALPVGTTMILQDKGKKDYYWFEVTSVADCITGINLEAFIRMGSEAEKFVPDNGNLDLQFVIDFSRVMEAFPNTVESVTTTLTAHQKELTGTEVNRAPTVANTKFVVTRLKETATFTLSISADNEGLLQYVYTPSEGVASKWDDRHMSLVLQPQAGVSLPVDAHITVSAGAVTATSYANANGDFVIPLAGLNSGDMTVKLGSSLFTTEIKTYGFALDWIVANSLAESSPMNGECVANQIVTLSGSNIVGPSLRIIGDQPLYTSGASSAVNATVSWADMPLNHELEVTLKRKTDTGEYTDTGQRTKIDREETDVNGGVRDSKELQVSLSGQSAGSYCLEVTADLGLVTVTRARFYFLLEDAKDAE